MTNSIPLSGLESSPSAKFVEIGDKHAGRISAIEQRQQIAMDKELLTFADGTPRMVWVISLEKADGEVVQLFAKGGNYKPESGSGESMLNAIGIAVRAADAQSLDVGGELVVAYTGEAAPAPGKKAKLYTAQYKPPAAASIPASDLFGE